MSEREDGETHFGDPDLTASGCVVGRFDVIAEISVVIPRVVPVDGNKINLRRTELVNLSLSLSTERSPMCLGTEAIADTVQSTVDRKGQTLQPVHNLKNSRNHGNPLAPFVTAGAPRVARPAKGMMYLRYAFTAR